MTSFCYVLLVNEHPTVRLEHVHFWTVRLITWSGQSLRICWHSLHSNFVGMFEGPRTLEALRFWVRFVRVHGWEPRSKISIMTCSKGSTAPGFEKVWKMRSASGWQIAEAAALKKVHSLLFVCLPRKPPPCRICEQFSSRATQVRTARTTLEAIKIDKYTFSSLLFWSRQLWNGFTAYVRWVKN